MHPTDTYRPMATSPKTRRKPPQSTDPGGAPPAADPTGIPTATTPAVTPTRKPRAAKPSAAPAKPAAAPAPAEAPGTTKPAAKTSAARRRKARPDAPAAAVPVADAAPAPVQPVVAERPAADKVAKTRTPPRAGAPRRVGPAAQAADLPPGAADDDTARAVLALLAAPVPVADVPRPRPTGPAHSRIALVEGDQRRLAWRPGHACPDGLHQAARDHVDAAGHLSPDDDGALPLLLTLAAESDHVLEVDEAVWAHLAAHRDARHRLAALEAAYPDGPASPALQQLLRAPLPLFQAEGALFAVVAGRALIADERGLGKGVQAIAAASLWRRHFGVRRVLVLCAPSQRAAWQRAWQRFDGTAATGGAQVIDGGLHKRQSMWSTAAGVRILSPEVLDTDAAHLAHWAPDLVIVDEPQQLALDPDAWGRLASPYALVLCGAALTEQPALMDAIVGWLDLQRLGPLAALRELQAASQGGRGLDEADIERLTASLSRLMLQRQRADVAEQLPPVVHSERLVPLAPGQREWHDRHAADARRVVAGWRQSGYCSDTDQWRLAVALREMQRACHRAEPSAADSVLADATVLAVAAQLDDWAATGAPRVAVRCATLADREQLARRLGADRATPGAAAAGDEGAEARAVLAGPDDVLPAALDAVLQVGVPWRPRRHPIGGRGETPPGQQWLYLVAQDSIECGLFDTLAQRGDAPRGLAEAGARDYLQGGRLTAWLAAVEAAMAAIGGDTG